MRLRPILMTSIAMIGGAVPLALSSGAGAEARNAIGTVIVGGVTLSTLLTVLVVPSIYLLLGGFTKPATYVGEMLDRLREGMDQKPARPHGEVHRPPIRRSEPDRRRPIPCSDVLRSAAHEAQVRGRRSAADRGRRRHRNETGSSTALTAGADRDRRADGAACSRGRVFALGRHDAAIRERRGHHDVKDDRGSSRWSMASPKAIPTSGPENAAARADPRQGPVLRAGGSQEVEDCEQGRQSAAGQGPDQDQRAYRIGREGCVGVRRGADQQQDAEDDVDPLVQAPAGRGREVKPWLRPSSQEIAPEIRRILQHDGCRPRVAHAA